MGHPPNLASFLLLASITLVVATSGPYAAQPKLLSQEGNLKIQAGWNKNITLMTSGMGQVFLNEENLVELTALARSASNQVLQFKSTVLAPLQEKVMRLVESVEGRDGIVRRMQAIENGATATGVSNITTASLSTITLSVQTLQRTVEKLQANLRKNECKRGPCKNGGTCFDLYNKFKCLCPAGWEGPSCELDVDECLKLSMTELRCQNGATCINSLGSFTCVCPPNFYGMHCATRNSSCVAGKDHELCENGRCVDGTGGKAYECVCDEGWSIGQGGRCNKDINECSNRVPVCSMHPPVECVNTPGSFGCGPCPEGYTGNGFYCVDIDECLVNNGGCSMTPYVECINTQGYRKCGPCPPGWLGDGTNCRQGLTGCAVNNGNCHPLAVCAETTDSHRSSIMCTCPAGMAGDGRGFMGCTSGMSSNPCAVNPCVNGACLVTGPGVYACSCTGGFTGKNCEVPIIARASCSPNPCENGGSCVLNSPSGVSCQCTEGFTGAYCSEETMSCGGTLGGSNGTLHSSASKYSRLPLVCTWKITSINEDRVLQLNFTRFNVYSKRGDCMDSYVEIRDADLPSHSSSSLGRFCSDLMPAGGVTSYSSKVTVTYMMTSQGGGTNYWSLEWTEKRPECGAMLNNITSPGFLSSPGFPRPYNTRSVCLWMLHTVPGYRLEFTMVEASFSGPSTSAKLGFPCSEELDDEYVKIYDGEMVYHPLLLMVCEPVQNLASVTSSGHEASVVYFSTSKMRSAFQLMYRPVPGIPYCGGTYTSPEGDVTSRHLGDSKQDLHCTWTIQLPANERLKLYFTEVEISSPSCDSYLEVYNAKSNSLLEKFCNGAVTRAPLISESNSVRIVYNVKYSATGPKPAFSIQYESVCGGLFTASSGIFTSPYYPRAYPKARICRYTIAQDPGKIIQLDLSVLDLTPPGDKDNACTYQSVKIFNGDSSNHTLLGEYCGSKIPNTILSTRNFIYLEFKTDGSIAHSGFQANYSTLDVGCGGIYTASSGMITLASPLQVASCEWILSAPAGHALHLTWLSFSVRADPAYIWWNFGNACSKLYVDVFDNGTSPATLMKKLCGVKTPSPMTSIGNVVTLSLMNKNFGQNKGPGVANFVLSYSVVNSTTMCGGNFYSSSGILTSPLYPDRYPSNKHCVWTITVPQEQQIRLNFTKFHLESSWRLNCANTDYLEVRDGGYETSPVKGKYCGTTYPRELISSSNQVYIKFVSDEDKNLNPGFKIIWDSAATGCGGILNAPSGSLASPNYPYPYNYRTTCYWHITVAQGSAVSLMTLDLNIDCFVPLRSELEVYEGDSVQGKLLGTVCSSKAKWSNILLSQTNSISIKYASSNLEDKGFHLSYTTLCNRTVTGYRGVIESINYPRHYESLHNCWWNISVPSGNQISLAFSDLALERRRTARPMPLWLADDRMRDSTSSLALRRLMHPGCFDYVEIFDTSVDDESVLAHLLNATCGKEKPPGVITSRSNVVFVHFFSDFGTSDRGFRLEWSLKGCGGVIENRPYGTITSPHYGEHSQGKYYGHNLQCDWQIKADLDHSIEMRITDIDLESDEDCSRDYLIIYNGLTDEGVNLTQRLCHQVEGVNTVFTGSNQVFVRFRTDISINGRGFKIYYKLVPSTCGGLYQGTTGIIHSKHYPKNYEVNDSCMYKISVPQGHLVNFTMEDLDLGPCWSGGRKKPITAVVNVYDGETLNAPLLFRYCGNTIPANATSLVSSTSTLLVHFLAGEFSAHKGFRASYSLACGARIVTDGSGAITLNTADIVSAKVTNCSWTIVAKNTESRVSFAVQSMAGFQMFARDWSEYTQDGFYAFDGENSGAPLIVKTPLYKPPSSVLAKGPALHIVLEVPRMAAHSLLHDKFFATYSVRNIACGGELKGDGGSFSSPNYPLQYPINSDCVWTVKSSPGNKISIQFSGFQLEDGGFKSGFCNEDYVELREVSALGPLLNVYCGVHAPANVTVADSFWIRFRSDGVGTATGFTADYSYVTDHEILGEAGGVIASPQYPDLYFNTKTFSWYIRVEQDARIRIKLLDSWLEGRGHDCAYTTTLKIYEGNAADESKLLHDDLCSAVLHTTLTSMTPEVLVVFDSNPLMKGSYFKLAWESVGVDAAAADKTNVTTSPLRHPFPYLKDARLVSLSLNISSSYSHISHSWNVTDSVIYEIRGPMGYRIQAQINNFTNYVDGLEFFYVDTSYTSVKVQIYSGSSDPFRQSDIVKLDELIENPNVNSSRAKIFKSFNNVLYLVVEQLMPIRVSSMISMNVSANLACGGIITGLTSGSLQMNPGLDNRTRFPGSIPPSPLTNLTCDWLVAARPRRTIRVEILSSDFTPKAGDGATTKECGRNYVQIRNGGSLTSPRLGSEKFCSPVNMGSFKKPTNTTSSNLLFVRYKSYYNFIQTFSLSFEETKIGCGGDLSLHDRAWVIINSPNYPEAPPSHVECVWSIQAPVHKKLQIQFYDDKFDLMSTVGCPDEYVEVRDGMTDVSPSLGKFCTTAPALVKNSGNSLLVKYYTNLDEPKNGFSANVSLQSCGGSVEDIMASISLPISYPELTEPECEWSLSTRPSYYFTLNVTKFNVNRVTVWSNCSRDSHGTLTIRTVDKLRPNQTRIVFSECNPTTVPFYLRTDSNKILVTYRKGSKQLNRAQSFLNIGDLSRTGFSITVTAVEEPCGGTLTAPSGDISLPCIPSGAERVCTWIIKTPGTRRVSVTPVSVEFGGNNNIPDELATFDSTHDAVGLFYHDVTDVWFRRPFALITQPSSINTPLYSSGPSVVVIARISSGCPNGGFKLKYSTDSAALCGGTLSDNGTLSSPNNLTTFSCEWSKVTPPYQTFAFSVVGTVSGQDSNKRCNSTSALGYILSTTFIVYDSQKQLIHRLCSHYDTPTTFLSPYSTTLLHAIKGRTYSGSWQYPPMSFNISYATYPCGGVLMSPSNISLPANTSSGTGGEIYCVWLVGYPSGDEIKITTSPQSTPCSHEFIYIYNGPRTTSPLLTTINPCSITSPVSVTSTSNLLWIEYRRTSPGTTGFRLDLEKVSLSCGDILSSPTGVVTSPGYTERAYPNNVECEWYIQVQSGFFISLRFQDRFFIQDSVNCSSDYLQVLDWMDDEFKPIARLCGRSAPTGFNSTRNQMKLVFHSDDGVSGDGFKVLYRSHCGGVYNGTEQGTIMSPNYPNNYPSNLNCNYTFIDPERQIALNFSDFRLEPSASCNFDYLTIASSSYVLGSLTDDNPTRNISYCGEVGPGYQTFVNWVTVLFHSDPFVSNRGFLLDFRMSNCGGEISSPQRLGVTQYRGMTQCVWNITAPKNLVVIVTVHKYVWNDDVFSWMKGNCDLGSLTFNEFLPNGTLSPTMSQICETTETRSQFRSSNNRATLTLLISDDIPSSDDTYLDFSVHFAFDSPLCNGPQRLGLNETVHLVTIDSSAVPFICDRDLYTSPDNVLKVDVRELNVQPTGCSRGAVDDTTLGIHEEETLAAVNTSGCWCNRVELSWGSNSPQVICMATQPILSINTGSPSIHFKFVETQRFVGLRYDIQVTAVLPECGLKSLTANTSRQLLVAPALRPGLSCVWNIAPSNENIQIRFLSLNLKNIDETCSDTYLQLLQDGVVLNKYCGQKLPSITYFPTWSSQSKAKRTIELVSNVMSRSPEGFKLEYQLVGCSRNYSSNEGNLVYMEITGGECQVIIYANVSGVVFSQFTMGTKNCATDKLVVRSAGAVTPLATLCDTGLPLPLFPTSSPLFLHLYASLNSTARVSLTFVTSSCDVVLRDPHGALASRNYPNPLRLAESCSVTIAPPRPVTLKFRTFDLGHASCVANYLRIETEYGTQEAKTVNYCGKEVPALVEVKEKARITYVTNQNNDGQGWYLTYEPRNQELHMKSSQIILVG